MRLCRAQLVVLPVVERPAPREEIVVLDITRLSEYQADLREEERGGVAQVFRLEEEVQVAGKHDHVSVRERDRQMLDESIVGLAHRGKLQEELLVVIVLALSEIRLLDELSQAVHEEAIDLVGVDQHCLQDLVAILWAQTELLVLVVVQDYLEDALLLQCLVLIKLVRRLEGVDRSVELLLGEGLRIHAGQAEAHAVGNLERLRYDLQDLRLACAYWAHDSQSLPPPQVLNDGQALLLLP